MPTVRPDSHTPLATQYRAFLVYCYPQGHRRNRRGPRLPADQQEDESDGAARASKQAKAQGAAGTVPKEPLGDRVFNQVAALVFLVLLPAGFVPRTGGVDEFTRHDGVVTATATTHLLFVIPFSRQTVTAVRDVAFDFESGGTSRSLNRYVSTPEDKGWLIISGGSGRAVVPVAAADGPDVAARITDFLGRADMPSLTVFTYAHRLFSLLVGGLVTLLTVCYVALWALRLKVTLTARRRRATTTAEESA